MRVSLKGKNCLSLLDFSASEIYYLLDLAADLKVSKQKKLHDNFPLKGMNILLLFQNESVITRTALEVAAYDLGIQCTYLGPSSSVLEIKEDLINTAQSLGRIYDGIAFRGNKIADLEMLAAKSGVPVWNCLTEIYHPSQLLADLLTIQECKNIEKLAGLKFVYFGDARYNVANSHLIACAKLGMNLTICCPKKFGPNQSLLKACLQEAKLNGGSISVNQDYKTAALNADIIATDIWSTKDNDQEEHKKNIVLLTNYQVNMAKIKLAKPNVIFLHCLPSFHYNKSKNIDRENETNGDLGELEVTNEVFNSQYSRVFQETENRMHAFKAIILATLKY